MIGFLRAVLLVALCATAAAQDAVVDELPQVGADAPEGSIREHLDKTHEDWSRRVMDLGVRLDRLFGGHQIVPDRSSYIRVSTAALLAEDDSDLDARLRARFALPNTERRLSLVLESEDDSRFDPARANQPSPPVLLRPRDERGFTAGLRYLRELGDRMDFDADAGVRLRFPPDPFVRARIGRSMFLGLWELRPSEEIYWRYRKGPGARTQLVTQRALSGPRFFRAVSEADWVHRDQRFYFAQDFVFSHEFTPFNAVQARIGARAETDPSRLTAWFANIGWRRKIYKDWLFAEVRPELLFEHEDDFRAEPRLFLTLEAYFGDIGWLETEGGAQ